MVFDMLVLQKHNTEMTTAAGEAFYTLVCLHQVWHLDTYTLEISNLLKDSGWLLYVWQTIELFWLEGTLRWSVVQPLAQSGVNTELWSGCSGLFSTVLKTSKMDISKPL